MFRSVAALGAAQETLFLFRFPSDVCTVPQLTEKEFVKIIDDEKNGTYRVFAPPHILCQKTICTSVDVQSPRVCLARETKK